MSGAEGISVAGPRVQRIGRYEIVRELGRGGMAIVYLARQSDLDRNVALKELRSFEDATPDTVHRFVRESRLAGELNHPNIVTVYEYFEDSGVPYIAMEYVSGGSLRSHLGHLSLPQIAGVLEGVLAGLAHAESKGVVHRDLKPENIMITADGRVKITDFGIAKAVGGAPTGFATATGVAVGTPKYMAPEQAMAAENIGPWTDLYSVGVLAYEMFVGHLPFPDTEAPLIILWRHVNEPIPPAVEVDPAIDPEISAWIDSLLVKDPARRMRHAAAAWDALDEAIVRLAGPFWRREARLAVREAQPHPGRPLTPAPFASQLQTPAPAAAASSGYITYGPRDVEPPAPEPPAPGSLQTVAPGPARPVPPAPAAPEQPDAVAQPQPSGYVTVVERQAPSAPAAPPSPPPEPVAQPEAVAEREPEPVAEPGPEPVAEPRPEPVAETRPEPVAETRPEPVAETRPVAVQEEPAPPPAAPAVVAEPSPRTTTKGPPYRRRRLVLVMAVAAALAAGIGFALAPPTEHRLTPVSMSGHAAAGWIAVSYPSTWRLGSPVAALASLKLEHPILLAGPSVASGGRLAMGTTASSDTTLLPSAFTDMLSAPPQADPVRLSGMTFLRYLNLIVPGSQTPVTVYALPTTRATIVAACVAPAHNDGSFGAACERVVASLRLTAASALPLGVNRTYADALSRIMGTRNVAVSAALARLAKAGNPAAQATAADALARAQADAARAVRSLTPGPLGAAANLAVASALSNLGRSFSALATAARRHDGRAFEAARSSAATAAAGLDRAFALLQRAGYAVR